MDFLLGPVGSEVNRMVVLAMDMKVDRIRLNIHDKSKVYEGDKVVKLIQTKLKQLEESLQEEADRIDLFDVLKAQEWITPRGPNISKNSGNSFFEG
ncbi:MAG: hypothetical protein WAK17_29895 [Candidatus Nitrosopolaris sp.]|jgi:hypothetical protein